MARKAPQRKTQTAKSVKTVEPQKTSSSWWDYFRFGESYTSLILGIIVVIITTILLVFTVKDRSVLPNTNGGNTTQEVSSTKIEPTIIADATIGQLIETGTPIPTVPPTVEPTRSASPTQKVNPTVQPTVKATVQPSAVPTTKPTASNAASPTRTVAVSPKPSSAPNIGGQKSYTVAAGDTLWKIAEQFYKSGYNWVDIASANKLSNPSVISTGTKLVIPNVAPKLATVQNTDLTAFGPKITGSTYTVQKGDHLWGIAVRAYGDGFRWTEIAKLNNITSPSLINVGIVLKLPRTNAPPAK